MSVGEELHPGCNETASRDDGMITPEFVQWLDSRGEPITLRQLTPETVSETAKWLAHPNNFKWLDFGGGRQILSEPAIGIMARSGAHCLRSCHDATGRLVGIAGLQNVDNAFGSAMLWGIRMRVRPPSRSNAVHQIRQIMKIGFSELGLKSVYAWVVDINKPSIATVKASGLREVGRQRKAHIIDGVHHDRLLFDILAEEFDAQERLIESLRESNGDRTPEEADRRAA